MLNIVHYINITTERLISLSDFCVCNNHNETVARAIKYYNVYLASKFLHVLARFMTLIVVITH